MTIATLAATCLTFSVLAQYWMGFKPCGLCLAQRYVYASLCVLGVLGWLLQAKQLLRYCLMVVLCVGVGVALYHSLVIFGVIESKCVLQAIQAEGTVNFSDMLEKPQTCTEPRMSFFGIPFSVINSLIYLAFYRKLIAK